MEEGEGPYCLTYLQCKCAHISQRAGSHQQTAREKGCVIQVHWSLEGTVRVRTHWSDAFTALAGSMWPAISFCGAFLSEGTDRNQTGWPTSRTAPRSPHSFLLVQSTGGNEVSICLPSSASTVPILPVH